mgnify:CR=1 FL=1
MFSPVNTLIALRDEYYEYTDKEPNWERLARILRCPNDDALREHVKELSRRTYGAAWANHFLNGEHYRPGE